MPIFTTQVLAIFAPKEPSIWLFPGGASAILVALWLGRKSRWMTGTCAVVATAFVGVCAAYLLRKARDPFDLTPVRVLAFDRAVVVYLCACLPLALSIVALFRQRSLSMRVARIWAATVIMAPIALFLGANVFDYVQFTGALSEARGA